MWMVLLAAQPASATSCAWGPSGALPVDGAIEVPSNVQPVGVYDGGASDDEVWLEDDEGETVTAEVSVWGDTATEQDPVMPLAPGTYRLVSTQGGILSTFDVVEQADLQAPDAPGIVDVEQHHAQGGAMLLLGPTHALEVTLSGGTDASGVVYEVRVTDAQGEALEVMWTHELQVWFGESTCASMPTILPDGDLFVDARARDAADNWSEWSEPVQIAFERPNFDTADDADGSKSGGCDTAGRTPGVALGLLALLLGMGRRRDR